MTIAKIKRRDAKRVESFEPLGLTDHWKSRDASTVEAGTLAKGPGAPVVRLIRKSSQYGGHAQPVVFASGGGAQGRAALYVIAAAFEHAYDGPCPLSVSAWDGTLGVDTDTDRQCDEAIHFLRVAMRAAGVQ